MTSKIILFLDIGNVLLKFQESKFKNFLEQNRRNNLSRDKFGQFYKEVLNDSFIGKKNLKETWESLFLLTNLSSCEIKRAKKLYQSIKNEDLIKFIKKNSDKFILGVISDLHQIAYNQAQKNLKDILSLCKNDLLFISCLTGKSKLSLKEDYLTYIGHSIRDLSGKKFYLDDEKKPLSFFKRLGFTPLHFEKGEISNSFYNGNKSFFNKMETLNIM